MTDPIVIINIFLIPFTSIYAYLKKSGRDVKFTSETFYNYSIIVILMGLVCRFAGFFFNMLANVKLEFNSYKYTIVALVIAFIIACVFTIAEKNIRKK